MNNGNLWGLRILALVLAIGIWWVISITAILRGISLMIWFRRNKWKTQSV